MSKTTLIQLVNLSYSAESFPILKDLSLQFDRGAIHGVLGVNGAGKSTLLNLMGGICRPTGGSILLNGEAVHLKSPHHAAACGIRMSNQEETLLPDFTVAENMLFSAYGSDPALKIISYRRREREMQRLLDRWNIPLRADQRASTLNYGSQQMLKIAGLLAGAQPGDLLLMDEPYRACSQEDIRCFHQTLRRLKEQGFTVILSTHRVEDALEVCDTLTLLRSEGPCEQFPAGSLCFNDIVSRISNRPFSGSAYPRLPAHSGGPLLRMQDVSTRRIENVSLTLNKGEILGIAGLLGSGRTGVARALCGLDKRFGGSITLNRESLAQEKNPSDRRIGALLCNRKESLLLDMDLSSNITVSRLGLVSSTLMLNTTAERKVGFDYCRQFNIDPRHMDDPARVLSAGNQQKLLLARLFFSNCRILVLDEPTMNIDVVSKNDVYNLMNSYICRGNSIIFISSDLEELKGMCHRIIIMKDRTAFCEISPEKLTYESLVSEKDA